MFGTSLGDGWGILAIAIAETELELIAIADFATLIAAGDSNARSLVEGWIQQLGTQARSPDDIISPETTVVLAESSQQISLQKGQILRSQPGTVVWVQVRSGNGSVEGLKLNSASPAFPLAGKMLLVAQGQVEVQIFSNTSGLTASLALLHEYFCCYLDLLVSQQNAEEFRRFQQRDAADTFERDIFPAEFGADVYLQPAASFSRNWFNFARGYSNSNIELTLNPKRAADGNRRRRH